MVRCRGNAMELSASIDIARTAEVVFAWLTAPERIQTLIGVEETSFPDGSPRRWEAEVTASGPLAVGTRLIYTLRRPAESALPPPLATIERRELEIIAFDPPSVFAVRTLTDPIPVELRFDLLPVGAATRLTITWTLRPRGVASALFARLGMMISDRRLANLMAQMQTAIEQA